MARFTITINTGSSMEQINQCWKAAEEAISQYMNHPFFTKMADGTLSNAAFQRYLEQDSLYVVQYARAMCLLAYKTAAPSDSAMLMRLTVDNFAIEKGLLDMLSQQFGVDVAQLKWHEGCRQYAHYLLSMVETQPVAVAAAALLPCYWVYHENGLHLNRVAKMDGNPYAEWIKTYSGEVFIGQIEQFQEYVERQANDASPSMRQQMAEAFKGAVEHEVEFVNAVMEEEVNFQHRRCTT